MPFTIAQVLDLLMIVVLIMFIPIGLWRGALREWIALAGVTLGYLLAAEWAGPWGGDLAAQTGQDAKMAAFLVGAGFFLGATLLIGYGGGAALPYRPDLTRTNRLLGALLGVGNGVLILSGTLRLMQRHLFDQQPDSLLLGTTLSRFLIDYVGWAQLALLSTLFVCVAISLLRRWAGGPPLMEEFAPAQFAAHAGRPTQPEEAWNPDLPDDAWEAAAHSEADEELPVATRGQGDTAVLHVLPSPGVAPRPLIPAQSPAAPAGPPARATTLVSVPRVVDIARPTRATPVTPSSPVGPAAPAAAAYANGHTPPREGQAGVAGGEQRVVGPGGDRPIVANASPPPAPTELAAVGGVCTACGHTAAARSRFCQHCGHIIGEAERRRVARQD